MKIICIMAALTFMVGCSPSSDDYRQVMETCMKREGQYFTVMIPSVFGNRLGAGCLEGREQ
jgi:hypothetical protein